jgi:hypothetical protein
MKLGRSLLLALIAFPVTVLLSTAQPAVDRPLPKLTQPAVASPREVLKGRSEPLVWFCPNGGSLDFVDLFEKPDQWAVARGKIDVFKFYLYPLIHTTPEARTGFGNNLWPQFQKTKAIAKLREWDIDIAIEKGVFPRRRINELGAEQTAMLAVKPTLLGIRHIEEEGGRVRYLAMDSPYLYAAPRNCNYPVDATVRGVAQFANSIARQHDDLLIGDIEPYPFFTAHQLEVWIDALRQQRVRLAFFHLDINYARLERNPNEARRYVADVRELQRFCDKRGIALGVILTSGYAPIDTDRDYYESALKDLLRIKSALGTPRHCIVQSYQVSSGPDKTVPRNLPETERSTHTYLVNVGVARLFDQSATCRIVQAPERVKIGSRFQLSVEARNTGAYSWTARRAEQLGILKLDAEGYRALRAIALNPEETVAPGESKRFTFELTAPATPGPTTYRCRMIQQLGTWFGESTPDLTIQVTP